VNAGLYAGVRVLELGCGGIAAPYATQFLADHGADVVKAEPPEGDPYRADPGFPTLNRGKRSVFAGAAARVADEALLRVADVIVVDRPGLGRGLRAANPGAVVVTMPPWGEAGRMSGTAGSPNLVAAATGIFWNQQSYSEAPVELVVPLVGYAQGMLGAIAAAAGLFARERDGVAVTYEVSAVAASAALQVGFETQAVAEPVLERAGSAPMGAKGRVPCYRLFEAADGRWFFLACGTPRFFERLLEVIGRPDLIGDPRLPAPPWGLTDPDAVAFAAPLLEEAMASRPREEWLELLARADIPAQPVQTRTEYLASSLVRHNQLMATIDDPHRGPVDMPGVPLLLEAIPGRIAGPAPLLGEHHAEVRAEWGAAPATSPLPPQPPDHAPLHDVAVLDLSSFIAGPVVGRHLAMLGADVVKIEAPGGDPFRAFGAPFSAWNQGKRSAVIDLQTAEGRRRVHRLASRWADVAVENFRVGVSARLGVDAATLRALNDRLVYLSSTGYGTDPAFDGVPAFDPLLQALGGIMAAQGGMAETGDGNEPVFLTVAVHDLVTPLLSTFGVVAALHHRLRTGAGQVVRTSLAQAALAAQAAEVTHFAGRPAARLGGWDHHGGCVRATDGTWRYVEDGEEVAVERFGLVNSPLAADNGLVAGYDHPEWGQVRQLGQLIGGAGPHPSRGPALGEHSEAIEELLR
jgi:crotonobetainyl-CoA:carnitine CoA-transferase CaiB-like acyl-CoA transferase